MTDYTKDQEREARKHNVVFDYLSHHNGEYWYKCTVCGARDWVAHNSAPPTFEDAKCEPASGAPKASSEEHKALEWMEKNGCLGGPYGIVLAMAKRTAEADAKLDAARVGSERWHSVALESQRERDALKARVAELEAKVAPPTVAPTREAWEALSEFAQTWTHWIGREQRPAARLVAAIRKMLEAGT